ncbi:MAG: beta-propeller fold lactonase family protein [Solirubrobacteraceae bacterium]
MRVLKPLAVALALSASAAALPAAASAHAGSGSPVVGHVYVNDNTVPANTVAGFARHADGDLTPLAGSPFSAGGAGTGAGVGSQGSLQTAVDGRYLLAVDAGSNQISVLRTFHDGTLTLVDRSPVSSDGTLPVSIAIHQRLVYVANAGNGAVNYTGFILGRDGRLRPLPASTVTLPDGSQPGDVLFNATGTKLAGTRVGTSLIDSFAVGFDGRLHAAPGSPYTAQGPGPFGSEFSPTRPDELFVSNAHGGAAAGSVSAFRVAFDGALSPVGASPFADHQTAPCWVEISHDGHYLFAINTAQPSISRYAINWDGSLTLLGSTSFKNPTGLAPVDARLSPDGRTLWVTDSGTPGVSAFAVQGGNLTELASSPTPLPTGAAPFGIVVN